MGIGASAGGLEACQKLVAGLPGDIGMAFVLIQHLDPTHESMMVNLLATQTSLRVQEAADGMLIEPNHLYTIPPGAYLSVDAGVLRVSEPLPARGSRLPFDFLLASLATAYEERAVCVILSGTGSDGTQGLKAIKKNAGLVIAQDPAEAAYDGMPRSAIATGDVDLVLPVTGIAELLLRYARLPPGPLVQPHTSPPDEIPDWLPPIVDLLRSRTRHDFTQYKQGTLRRRIERRMTLSGIELDARGGYLDRLRSDPAELELLATDLLINVTSFFRDPKVFDLLSSEVIPALLRDHPSGEPLRVWVAGCSSGEETYSLAMLFREQITAAKLSVRLQIFASDADPDAVASARDGLYPESIEAEVSPARLALFFVKEALGYRVSPELRAAVVFTVQDVLTDPPFSQLDFVSCRNLLIYLQPAAQAKVLGLFHFALREGGILLLGSSETPGEIDGRFAVISKSARLYRHIARGQPGEMASLLMGREPLRVPARGERGLPSTRQDALAELSRLKVIEAFAPAVVLINNRHEWLYALGPVERYLRVPAGVLSSDLLTLVPQSLRTRLRSSLQLASDENRPVVAVGARIDAPGISGSFNIEVMPVQNEGEQLLLVCFVDVPAPTERRGRRTADDGPRVAELEQELAATRLELRGAIHNLESSTEEQQAINEEALSVNEEYQSTNEELLTSKEELQSLNEELTALNSQLQETLERQRTTSNDLQNVLYSTDVATIFLDRTLRIRLFTPATRSLFNVIPSDVGRPLSDLHALAADDALLADARAVLSTSTPREREIKAEKTAAWYVRRILPYRTDSDSAGGVVITFVDITERKATADALAAAEREAQLASLAKSRFLAAASHDLRQPLQAQRLMRGVLAKLIMDDKRDDALAVVTRLEDMAGSMTGMLDAMLDINQIEAGIVRVEKVDFSIDDLLTQLHGEFAYQAKAQGLRLGLVHCRLPVRSDPALLEQMIRNLLSNALKYTASGSVLLGCRRRPGSLLIQVCDTGTGIPNDELDAIFEEYHQVSARSAHGSRGLGLGLSIVRRLAEVLDHRVSVRSLPGAGSIFSVEVALAPAESYPVEPRQDAVPAHLPIAAPASAGSTVVVVEDDADVREFLARLLTDSGYRSIAAADAAATLALLDEHHIRPDLLLADYNLPGSLSGLDLAAKLRQSGRPLPVIVLTGDISTEALRAIARADCVKLNKPVDPRKLIAVIDSLLTPAGATPLPHQQQAAASSSGPATIFVVDDDADVREAIRLVLEATGLQVETFPSAESFVAAGHSTEAACLLVDAYLPGMSGLDLLQKLGRDGSDMPAVMITGSSDVSMAVAAMKAGALDFVEKPIGGPLLVEVVTRALKHAHNDLALASWRETSTQRLSSLTPREQQILSMVLAGQPSKNIAADLGISQRTIENHRAAIMKKTGSKSIPALVRLALAAN